MTKEDDSFDWCHSYYLDVVKDYLTPLEGKKYGDLVEKIIKERGHYNVKELEKYRNRTKDIFEYKIGAKGMTRLEWENIKYGSTDSPLDPLRYKMRIVKGVIEDTSYVPSEEEKTLLERIEFINWQIHTKSLNKVKNYFRRMGFYVCIKKEKWMRGKEHINEEEWPRKIYD